MCLCVRTMSTFSKTQGSDTAGQMSVKLGMYILWVSDKTSRKWSFEFRPLHCAGEMTHPSAVLIMRPPRRGGGRGIRWSSASVVRPSDVAYIGSTSKTKRPRKTKLCTGVPQVTCDSHTDFKVKCQGHGAGAYCGGHLAAQLVIIIIIIYYVLLVTSQLC